MFQKLKNIVKMPRKSPIKVMTFKEIVKKGAAIHRVLSKQITIDRTNATCTLKIKYPYEVDLETICTERDLLAWTLHLAKKPWMKPRHIAFFIEQVGNHKGFNLQVYGSGPDHSTN